MILQYSTILATIQAVSFLFLQYTSLPSREPCVVIGCLHFIAHHLSLYHYTPSLSYLHLLPIVASHLLIICISNLSASPSSLHLHPLCIVSISTSLYSVRSMKLLRLYVVVSDAFATKNEAICGARCGDYGSSQCRRWHWMMNMIEAIQY